MTRSSLAVALVTRYLRYWLPVLLWMGVIFVVSSRPRLPCHPNDTVDLVVKKAGHLSEYGALAFLLWRAISKERGWPVLPSLGGAFFLSLLYAASDEFHQTFVPGRDGTLRCRFRCLGSASGVMPGLVVFQGEGWRPAQGV